MAEHLDCEYHAGRRSFDRFFCEFLADFLVISPVLYLTLFRAVGHNLTTATPGEFVVLTLMTAMTNYFDRILDLRKLFQFPQNSNILKENLSL